MISCWTSFLKHPVGELLQNGVFGFGTVRDYISSCWSVAPAPPDGLGGAKRQLSIRGGPCLDELRLSSCPSAPSWAIGQLPKYGADSSSRSIIGGHGATIRSSRWSRKRGNPNWGKSGPPSPATATGFEMQVRQLGLSKQTLPTQRNYADGANAIEIGATFRNGCLTCGKSR